MRWYPAYFLCLLAAPAVAQDEMNFADRGERVLDMAVLERCAGAEKIGVDGCDAADLAENLGLISGSEIRPFGKFGMESFAMLTSLRYAASSLFFLAEGEPCYAEEERGAAVEIWSLWVELPPDIPQVMAEKYAVFDGVMDKIVTLELGC
ncbi:hypothetical protein [Algicella marina]|uniref:Secreted protein n=1 Tax=Algicella marina TaxID=2683284 RepID=A0A6P1SYR7_9RHOB|nr:hypothetical protein [Algicella marina]QHQ34621.1 hypothetical protein GO499_05155 [Algicella marina]